MLKIYRNFTITENQYLFNAYERDSNPFDIDPIPLMTFVFRSEHQSTTREKKINNENCFGAKNNQT